VSERGVEPIGVARLRRETPAKLAVSLGLAAGICIPYFTLQRVALFPARVPPETALDLWIAFDPRWVFAYLSIALLVALAPLLATQRDELRRYARGLAWLCVPCFVAFLLVPVLGPRPQEIPAHGAYAWLVGVDRPTNSLPSLHAGLAVYSLLFGLRVTRGVLAPAARAAVVAAGALWSAAILYATLATKQHWALDLPPGVLLACAAHALAWRAQPEAGRGRARSTAKSVHAPTATASSDRY
jgi:hypothetical protein